MGHIYLIRHAQPTLPGVFLGRTDSPLSAAGHAEAGRDLSHLRPSAVYSSPLSRAVESAQYIHAPDRFVIVPGLAEIDYGEWEMKGWDDIDRLWPEMAAAKRADWLLVTPPGAESWCDFKHRVLLAWRTIIGDDTSPIAVVAHMAVNAVIAEHIWGLDPAKFFQEYCEILEGEF